MMMEDRSLFDFAAFPVLSTERLVLRRLEPSDAADVFVFRGDAEVQMYNDEPLEDEAAALDFIGHLNADYDAQHNILWAMTLRGENRVLGLCGFGYWDRMHQRAAIGYDMARSHWGQGLAIEAVRAALNFGFDRMQLNRVEAETVIDNTRSVRLLERLGFTREGSRREFTLEADGKFHDDVIYGLLRREWQP
jgi:ribosomal-protein-alanine N-acetyltransferase